MSRYSCFGPRQLSRSAVGVTALVVTIQPGPVKVVYDCGTGGRVDPRCQILTYTLTESAAILHCIEHGGEETKSKKTCKVQLVHQLERPALPARSNRLGLDLPAAVREQGESLPSRHWHSPEGKEVLPTRY